MTKEHRQLLAQFREALLDDVAYSIEIAQQASSIKLKRENKPGLRVLLTDEEMRVRRNVAQQERRNAIRTPKPAPPVKAAPVAKAPQPPKPAPAKQEPKDRNAYYRAWYQKKHPPRVKLTDEEKKERRREYNRDYHQRMKATRSEEPSEPAR